MTKGIIRFNIAKASERIAELKFHRSGEGAGCGHISPKSGDWNAYQNAKHDASLWLTALKILKAAEKHGLPLKTKSDFNKILAADAEEYNGRRAARLRAIKPNSPGWVCSTREAMESPQSIYAHGGRSLAMRAFNAIRKTASRLEKDPGRYAEAGKWVAKKAAEVPPRGEPVHMNTVGSA